MNKKSSGIAFGVAVGIAALVSDLNHHRLKNQLPMLNETKPVIKWNMRDYANYPIHSKCEVFEAHESNGSRAVLYDCGSENTFMSFPFLANKPDGKVDYVMIYKQKGTCEEITYHANVSAAQWQPMLDEIKKSKKLQVIPGKFTRAGFC